MSKFGHSAALVAALLVSSAAYAQDVKEEYLENEHMEYVPFQASDILGAPSLPHGLSSAAVKLSFDGISQYDVAAVGRNFIPPDTMGAVGRTQYMEMVNGGVAVFDKATGARTSFVSDLAFWAGAGQTGANGDSRVMFDARSDRWIALSFGSSVSDIQIAVSRTSDALGPWQSTKFTGFAGGTADYPTLALDNNAVYIGTNNYNGDGNFRGTTLNVIPLSSLVSALAPTTAGMTQFVTPYLPGDPGNDYSRGYAIQGVNSSDVTTTGHVIAASLISADINSYDILNAGTPGATRSASTFVGTAGYDGNGPGRQPNAVPDFGSTADFPNNDRVIDTLDDRIGSSAYEVNGKIYSVHTVTPTGSDYTVIRWDIVDATTHALLGEGDIGDGMHDYYQGSLAVNQLGQVVIGYDRSGFGADGVITFATQVFKTVGNVLVPKGSEIVLRTSLVDDYHNGSLDGQIARGRQRWGDYSAVSLDPSDISKFWVIGEYAREYNDPAGGHPLGTGGSRWGTWIAEIDAAAVPEPASWLTMLGGFGMLGIALRPGRRTTAVTYDIA